MDNPIDRYAIRDRTPGVKTDAGRLQMALRTYGPGEAIIKQTWQPPTVKKVA